jgi:hypothetical protein
MMIDDWRRIDPIGLALIVILVGAIVLGCS